MRDKQNIAVMFVKFQAGKSWNFVISFIHVFVTQLMFGMANSGIPPFSSFQMNKTARYESVNCLDFVLVVLTTISPYFSIEASFSPSLL